MEAAAVALPETAIRYVQEIMKTAPSLFGSLSKTLKIHSLAARPELVQDDGNALPVLLLLKPRVGNPNLSSSAGRKLNFKTSIRLKIIILCLAYREEGCIL